MMKAYASPFEPEQILSKIEEIVDHRKLDLSQKTLFHGDKPIIGEFEKNIFKLQKRMQTPWKWSFLSPGFWFKPVVTGRIIQQDKGSMLELEGGSNLVIKIVWALLILGVTAIGALLTVFNYPVNIVYEPLFAASSLAGAIFTIGLIVGVLVLIPLIGWALTYKELDEIDQALAHQLSLNPLPLR